ncbi:hypothetical protein EUX57_19115 [Pseudomonas orientalis]|uniref:Uncharacterized protein n=1 Tax=Pseudomonas orientalis TaxID=76758 RepID=A0A4Q7CXI6_9PSED|nr:hypothetical protein EUX57_19115 [Pseudomonas orientalis]
MKAAYWLLSKLTGRTHTSVGASLLAKVGNNNAGSQDKRGDGEFFASKLAPAVSRSVQESRRKSGGIGRSLSGSGRLPLPARYWRIW